MAITPAQQQRYKQLRREHYESIGASTSGNINPPVIHAKPVSPTKKKPDAPRTLCDYLDEMED